MKNVAFYTLGCKVNQYETEAMEELFHAAGYETVPFDEPADIYIINTCSVTSMGDSKSRRIIRRAKKNNPHAIIAVTGCYAQTAPDEVLDIEGVNLVTGTQGRKDIVNKIEELTVLDKINDVHDIMNTHEFEEMNVTHYEHRTRAFIKIQDGCSQFCSYCIIPFARGPVRSRKDIDIIREIKTLVKNGYTEFILTGIHVAAYGHDLECTSLAGLINDIDKIDGIRRIRLSSIEPMTLNKQFIDDIKGAKKLCPHFHLSLQSGCDATLKRMNRHYSAAQFKEIADGLRAAFDDAAITTDIMVGFPGETDEEFEETVRFVKDVDFAGAHVFQYSMRRGTPAARRRDQIPPHIKEKRSKEIIEITQKSKHEFLQRHIGATAEVLFEQPVKGGYFEGKTANYITVRVKTSSDLHMQYRNVKLEEIHDGIMYGELIL